jgi:MYXO-CTERM domain-containing protein
MKMLTPVAACIALCLPSAAQAIPFPGPDGFGYSGSSIDYNLRDVSLSGTDIGLDDEDEEVSLVDLGFDFSFYGTSYSQVEVSSNGFLSFTPTGDPGCCSPDPIPTTDEDSADEIAINNFIAGYWQDLDPSWGGTIRTETRGTSGALEFVLGFYEVLDYDLDSSVNTFEIILHQVTNDIELQYNLIQYDDVDTKLAGIENQDGTDGLQLFYIDPASSDMANGDIIYQRQGFCISAGDTQCGTPTGSVPTPSVAVLLLAGLGLLRRRRATHSPR